MQIHAISFKCRGFAAVGDATKTIGELKCPKVINEAIEKLRSPSSRKSQSHRLPRSFRLRLGKDDRPQSVGLKFVAMFRHRVDRVTSDVFVVMKTI